VQLLVYVCGCTALHEYCLSSWSLGSNTYKTDVLWTIRSYSILHINCVRQFHNNYMMIIYLRCIRGLLQVICCRLLQDLNIGQQNYHKFGKGEPNICIQWDKRKKLQSKQNDHHSTTFIYLWCILRKKKHYILNSDSHQVTIQRIFCISSFKKNSCDTGSILQRLRTRQKHSLT
jgi:hypothetical protein